MSLVSQVDIEIIQTSGMFDENWYSEQYPDVNILGMSPIEHYLWIGAKLGRDPGPNFSTKAYLSAYRDVKAANLNPLMHFAMHGQSEGRSPRPALKPIDHVIVEAVDIVVPVFNALPDVQRCLKSILVAKTTVTAKVIVVDDGSSEETRSWLASFCEQHYKQFSLVSHPSNQGYTIAVNSGLRQTSAEFVVLLNSDTLVTNGWLDALVRCAQSDKNVGIVGPLSNAASWQSVPNIFDENGDFSINPLPVGFTPDTMASIVSSASRRDYPRVKFVNGFCFMIKRSVIDAIGYMDEDTFPQGYGEENDYCIRTHDSGFELAIADDCYVFHAKSKSFGHERRKELSSNASRLLAEKHTEEKIQRMLQETKKSPKLLSLRERVVNVMSSYGHQRMDVFQSRIIFVLPVPGGGGGAHSVVQEAAEMRRMGVNAQIGVHFADLPRYNKSYPSLKDADLFVPIDFSNAARSLSPYDIIVATTYKSVSLLEGVRQFNPYSALFYYAQDYEPLFFPEGSPNWHTARSSYTLIPGLTVFAKTHWIRQKIEQEHGVFVHKVSPSIDHTVYFPGRSAQESTVQVAAMIRPMTPYRGAERTMRVLKRLSEHFPNGVKVQIFGCSDDEIVNYNLETAFPFENHGALTREGVAGLLRSSDVFLDLSDYQAFGRTSLEAMACGCVPVVPSAGGGDEYAVSGENSEVVDTTNEDQAFEAAARIIKSKDMRLKMRVSAIETAARYSPTLAAASELRLFSEKGEVVDVRRDLHLCADVRGDGKPTGSGFVRVLLPYTNSVIQHNWRVIQYPAGALPNPAGDGIALIQRRAVGVDEDRLKEWVRAWKDRGNRIVFEIDDNLLDERGLVKRGVTIDIAEMRRKIEFLARNSDVVIASTTSLVEVMKRYNPRVVLIENYLDSDLWQLDAERDHKDGPFARSDDVIRVGYIGTPTHGPDLDVVEAAINRIEREYAGRVSVEVIGAWEGGKVKFGSKVNLPKKTEYPSFVEWLLKRVHWDIGIIPLVDDEFNESKSHLKFLEYAALDMAIVCSDVPSYQGIARSGRNALVVKNNDEDWYQAIRKLIEDKTLRSSIASAARATLKNSYTIEARGPEYLTALEAAYAAGSKAKASMKVA